MSNWLEWASTSIKQMLIVGAFVWATLAGATQFVLWKFEPQITAYILERVDQNAPLSKHNEVCTTIPERGHYIDPVVRVGEWHVIKWNDVVRHREDCGIPTLHAVVSNGSNALHTVDLSIEGIALELGEHDLIYKFRLREDDGITAGPGFFRVYVSFPNGKEEISPWMSFQIVE